MEQNLEQTIALLERTPATLNTLLRGLPDAWTSTNEGGNTWCALEIVGHLIQGERADWIPRTRMILESGETATFEPFDRAGHARENEGKQIGELLDEFARVRAESLRQLRALALTSQDLDRCGKHPAFGTVTLSQLLATWAAHDLTHLHQISRVMAYQYRDLVGPWSAYLGALHCNGHGS